MAILIPYVKQIWIDGNASNPVSAARMGVLEEGILDVSFAPAVQASHSTTNSVATATTVSLACNTDNIDQAGGVASTMHDTVTNNSRLTALYAGVYLVEASNVSWSASGVNVLIQFRKTGATVFGAQNLVGDWRQMGTTAMVPLAVNDYVELQVRQNSGGTLTIGAGFEFGMVRVG